MYFAMRSMPTHMKSVEELKTRGSGTKLRKRVRAPLHSGMNIKWPQDHYAATFFKQSIRMMLTYFTIPLYSNWCVHRRDNHDTHAGRIFCLVHSSYNGSFDREKCLVFVLITLSFHAYFQEEKDEEKQNKHYRLSTWNKRWEVMPMRKYEKYQYAMMMLWILFNLWIVLKGMAKYVEINP